MSYYFALAVRNLRRRAYLSSLIVLMLSVGVGTSTTTLAVVLAMDRDPLPAKSQTLYVVQLDNWGPNKPGEKSEDDLEELLSYQDASALARLDATHLRSPMYITYLKGRSHKDGDKPFAEITPAVTRDFFPMFQSPFLLGAPWTNEDDRSGSPVAVISEELNHRLFGGVSGVGETLSIAGAAFQVVGVLKAWSNSPRPYETDIAPYGNADNLYIPFNTAVHMHLPSVAGTGCKDQKPTNWDALLSSECVWVQFWIQLNSQSELADFRLHLTNYSKDQQAAGRFQWPPHFATRSVKDWLRYRQVAPRELGVLTLTGYAFLLVCIVNAASVMLTSLLDRSQELGIRRALGASRTAIFHQCLVETFLLSLACAVMSLLVTVFGAWVVRRVLSQAFAGLQFVDGSVVGIEIMAGVIAMFIASAYPVWRAVRIDPALQIKSE